jgi:hypothetical protein
VRKTAGTVDGMRTLSLLLAAVSCSVAVAQRMLAADAKRISQHTVSSLSPPHVGQGVFTCPIYALRKECSVAHHGPDQRLVLSPPAFNHVQIRRCMP